MGIFSRDFLIEVAKGNLVGHSLVHLFGRNASVGASFEGVSLFSDDFNFLEAATSVRIKAGGNVNDTAGGSGAQSVTVVGLTATLDEVSENIATAGSSASSPTSTLFCRIYQASVSDASAGTYGDSNTGDITIENGSGGIDLLKIAAAEGRAQHAAYAIPAGKTGYFLSALVTTDGNKAADIRGFTRRNLNGFSAPFEPALLNFYWAGVLGSMPFAPKSPAIVLPAGTDIWFDAKAGAVTEVSVDFEILLIDDQ